MTSCAGADAGRISASQRAGSSPGCNGRAPRSSRRRTTPWLPASRPVILAFDRSEAREFAALATDGLYPYLSTAKCPRHPSRLPVSLFRSVPAEAFGEFQYPTPPISRSRDGIHDRLDIETARATADTLNALHTDLQAGASISGPAARRAIRAAGQAPAFAGAIRTRRQARDIPTWIWWRQRRPQATARSVPSRDGIR